MKDHDPTTVDVCLLVEGTYPYVSGGVSAWVHDIIRGHPEHTFSILNIGSHPGAYGEPRYVLPDNVLRLDQLYCQDGRPPPCDAAQRRALEDSIRNVRGHPARAGSSRVLKALRRLLLEDTVDGQLLADLSSGDLSTDELLHGEDAFDLICEVAERVALRAPFLDVFWHFRAIHLPIVRLLAAVPGAARCYHAVSTGYAGLVGAALSLKTGRPLAVTEHGIYSRERDMDLARATWIKDEGDNPAPGQGAAPQDSPGPSPLRRLWSHSFRALAQIAYHQATRIITLSDINRRRQIVDGAPPDKISVVPNGVDVPVPDATAVPPAVQLDAALPERRPLRVGFVGRVVPIKDVITFIKACHMAMQMTDLDVRIIGPAEEDAAYSKRCHELVTMLGRQDSIAFVGPQPFHLIYANLDVVVLTSFSEGQPLVMLEAYAAGLPVIASDVGACREMIEGREAADRDLGPSGIVTRVANPPDTAAAMVRLAQDLDLRRRLGLAGRRRVSSFYRRHDMLESYRTLYQQMVTS